MEDKDGDDIDEEIGKTEVKAAWAYCSKHDMSYPLGSKCPECESEGS